MVRAATPTRRANRDVAPIGRVLALPLVPFRGSTAEKRKVQWTFRRPEGQGEGEPLIAIIAADGL